jgi:hypothetical protein
VGHLAFVLKRERGTFVMTFRRYSLCVLAMLVSGFCLMGQTRPSAGREPAGAPGISEGFRSAAENVLDCLDGADLVAVKTDAVFYPQILQCRAMLRKLERLAATTQEHSLARSIFGYQTEIAVCHLTGGPCDGNKEARDKAIQEGRLREPDAPGR